MFLRILGLVEKPTYVRNLGLWSDRYPWIWVFPQLRLGPLEFTFSSRETVDIFIQYLSNLLTLSANSLIDYLRYSSGLKAFGIFGISYTWCIFWALCIWIFSVAFIHEWFDIKLLNNKCFIPIPGLRGIFLPQKETCLFFLDVEAYRHFLYTSTLSIFWVQKMSLILPVWL